jgi:hypothetical protein
MEMERGNYTTPTERMVGRIIEGQVASTLPDEKMMMLMVINKMLHMAYVEIIHEVKPHPMMAWSERPPLPDCLYWNPIAKELYLPPNFVELDPLYFELIDVNDPPKLLG